jgi:hypothetical protein
MSGGAAGPRHRGVLFGGCDGLEKGLEMWSTDGLARLRSFGTPIGEERVVEPRFAPLRNSLRELRNSSLISAGRAVRRAPGSAATCSRPRTCPVRFQARTALPASGSRVDCTPLVATPVPDRLDAPALDPGEAARKAFRRSSRPPGANAAALVALGLVWFWAPSQPPGVRAWEIDWPAFLEVALPCGV